MRRERLAPRLLLTSSGLMVFSVGLVLNIQANVGLGPWSSFSYGVMLHLPVSFGQASMLIGVVMVALSWLLGVPPGIATALNLVITGLFTDLLLMLKVIPLSSGGLDSYVTLGLGIVVSGLGSAMYIKAGLGAGPRDSFMLGLAMRSRGRVGLCRSAMELTATAAGWLLGGPIGPGTVLWAFGLGPSVGYWFRVLKVPVKRKPVPGDALETPAVPSA